MLLAELRAIREQLARLELRVDALTGKGAPVEVVVKTYVDGLDEGLGGGIPRGHVVMLGGPSGTMKTSLALYIMQKNRAEDVRGIYLTLEESRESLLRTMTRLGIGTDEDFIVDIGKLRMEHEAAEDPRDWLQILKDYLSRRLEKGKLDLVVIDPLNSLYALAGIKDPRKDLFHFFAFLRGIGVTSILIMEAEANDIFFPNHEDYLADGVLALDFPKSETSELAPRLRCMKMRHMGHSRASFKLTFGNGRFAVGFLGAKPENDTVR
jgi:KaiC/GvpD/RAD55 family RecA-like ATPase